MNDKARQNFEDAGADLESPLHVADLEIGDKVLINGDGEFIVDEVVEIHDGGYGSQVELEETGRLGSAFDYEPGQDEMPHAVPYDGEQ